MKNSEKSPINMPNRPKPGGYLEKNARDRSAEEAQSICHAANELAQYSNDPHILKLVYRIRNSAGLILRHLEASGAMTRPE